jgi:hypothetical protein
LAESIIQSHRSGDADRIFTQKFVPISFTIEQNEVSEDEFESILFGYMLEFGINNVRGGKYTDLIWTHEQYNTIKTNIGTLLITTHIITDKFKLKNLINVLIVSAIIESSDAKNQSTSPKMFENLSKKLLWVTHRVTKKLTQIK